MKKTFTLLFFVCVLALPFGARAQMYQKGDISINAGVSFGVIGYGGYGYGYGYGGGFIPVTANVEYSINDLFAVGAFGGFYSRSYRDVDWRFTSLAFGGRGTIHATGLLNEWLDGNMDENKLDLYGSLLLGIRTYRLNYNDVAIPFDANDTGLVFGPVLGARYMFNPKIGAHAELGVGAFGVATIGVTLKP